MGPEKFVTYILPSVYSTVVEGVDKTRNTEHSGTCRNIPETPGTSRTNIKKYKKIVMKKKNNDDKIVFVKINNNVK